jgi:hypothetical protein
MEMRFPVSYLKRDFHHRIQAGNSLFCEITVGIKHETVKPSRECGFVRQELNATSILIGAGLPKSRPVAGWLPPLQANRDTWGRLTQGRVQNVS